MAGSLCAWRTVFIKLQMSGRGRHDNEYDLIVPVCRKKEANRIFVMILKVQLKHDYVSCKNQRPFFQCKTFKKHFSPINFVNFFPQCIFNGVFLHWSLSFHSIGVEFSTMQVQYFLYIGQSLKKMKFFSIV